MEILNFELFKVHPTKIMLKLHENSTLPSTKTGTKFNRTTLRHNLNLADPNRCTGARVGVNIKSSKTEETDRPDTSCLGPSWKYTPQQARKGSLNKSKSVYSTHEQLCVLFLLTARPRRTGWSGLDPDQPATKRLKLHPSTLGDGPTSSWWCNYDAMMTALTFLIVWKC